jgi:hypothetical protein
VAASPSFKCLISYAENPPQEAAIEKQDLLTSTWIGDVVRKEQGRLYYSAVSRSDGFRPTIFNVGDNVMVMSPEGGLPYVARIEALFEVAESEGGERRRMLTYADGASSACSQVAQDQANENKLAQLRWYYRPCDCQGHEAKSRFQQSSKSRAKEVFASAWTDENPVDSFLKVCYVLPHDVYTLSAAENYDDVFFCKERYCPVKRRFAFCEDEIRRRDHKTAVRILSKRKEDSYRKPKIGSDYQCIVPPFGRANSPSCERGDKLVFDPTKAFNGSDERSAAVDKLVKTFRINSSSSPGVSEEIALMALYRTGGNVRKAEVQLKCLQEQHLSGADAASAAAQRRQAEAMEREKKDMEREKKEHTDHTQPHSREISVKLDTGEGALLSSAASSRRSSGTGGASRKGGGRGAAHFEDSDYDGENDVGASVQHEGLVQLDCEKPFPDGSCSNKGVFFDIVNKGSVRVLVTSFTVGSYDAPAEVGVFACNKGPCSGSVSLIYVCNCVCVCVCINTYMCT